MFQSQLESERRANGTQERCRQTSSWGCGLYEVARHANRSQREWEPGRLSDDAERPSDAGTARQAKIPQEWRRVCKVERGLKAYCTKASLASADLQERS